MNAKTEEVLELGKVKEILKKYTFSMIAIEKINKLSPTSDIDIVRKLQQETREGINILKNDVKFPLEGIRDIRKSIHRAKIDAVLYPKELLYIASTMRASRLTKKLWQEKKIKNCEIIDEKVKSLQIFKPLEEEIFKAIVGEDEIADDASPKLYSIRNRKKNLMEEIRIKLNQMINSPSYQKVLQDPIITTRRGRYVIPVKQEYKGLVPGVIHDQSSSGATLFIEPMAVVERNNELRQLEVKEEEEILRILMELTAKIRENYVLLENTLDILVDLEVIFAKANYALRINGVEPKINDQGFIDLKTARHPLLKGEVVPIDVKLGDKFSILVITGPNTGGKTVSLKTVGLLTLMMQMGLHIPAKEGSEMSVFKKIFADIGDEQSIEQSLSTFSSHMKNIKSIIEEATNDSLILLDELGSGTDPSEGAALAMSILSYFYNKGSKVIATTHYSELKSFAHSKEGIENASVEFDVESLKPTYKLTIGIPGKSNALEIAKRLGLSETVISTAKSFIDSETLKVEDLLGHIEREKTQAEKETIRLKKLQWEYQKKLKDLEDEQEKTKRKYESILEKTNQKAKDFIYNIRREAELIIEELKDLDEKVEKSKRDQAIQRAREWLKGASKKAMLLDKSRKAPQHSKSKKDFKLGEKVYVANLEKEGHIVEIDKHEKQALVQIGILKFNVSLNDLYEIENETIEGTTKSNKYAHIGFEKSKTISTEIDLRGKTLDDALINVDRFLDDALMAGIPSVTIIHGKGTGVLRKGIQQMLRRRKNLCFRNGDISEGGTGVTVVEFK